MLNNDMEGKREGSSKIKEAIKMYYGRDRTLQQRIFTTQL